MNFWEMSFLGNSLARWTTALAVWISVYLILLLIKRAAILRLKNIVEKSVTHLDNLFYTLLLRTKGLFLLLFGAFLATLFLYMTIQLRVIIDTIFVVALILQAALWSLGLIDHFIYTRVKIKGDEAANRTMLDALSLLLKIALWSIVLLLILENITGIKVDSLVASLGITGVAVALAVQKILGDLFASLSIAFDQPFVIGDTISVGDITGSVEHIGLKSTRIRSMNGEQVILSNSDLLGSRIHNFKRMDTRLVTFQLGMVSETPYAKLAAIPQMIKEIIEPMENATFQRCHFRSYGDYALVFETVYTMNTADYTQYLNTQQAILLKIYQRFDQEGIQMAYPTQKVLLEKVEPAS